MEGQNYLQRHVLPTLPTADRKLLAWNDKGQAASINKNVNGNLTWHRLQCRTILGSQPLPLQAGPRHWHQAEILELDVGAEEWARRYAGNFYCSCFGLCGFVLFLTECGSKQGGKVSFPKYIIIQPWLVRLGWGQAGTKASVEESNSAPSEAIYFCITWWS